MSKPPHDYRVVDHVERFRGAIFDVFSDRIEMPGGGTAVRDYTRNLGSVGVVALDEADRVVLVRQYRHPVARLMWELPAGLLDVTGEAPEITAARELAEEAGLMARTWSHLLDVHTSPGFTDELARIYLATDLTEAPGPAHVREHEESELTVHRVSLDDAVAMVFDGRISNSLAVTGLLAASRRR